MRPKWIPVSENKPIPGTRVLVVEKHGLEGSDDVKIAELDEQGVWRDDSHDAYLVTQVSHWMSLDELLEILNLQTLNPAQVALEYSEALKSLPSLENRVDSAQAARNFEEFRKSANS